MSTWLFRLGRWAARHPWRVVGAWALVLATLGGLAAAYRTPTSDVVDIPDARFSAVMTHLEERIPDVTGVVSTVVVSTDDGQPMTQEQRQALAEVIDRWEQAPHVTQVVDPFATQAQMDRADRQLARGERRLARAESKLDAAAEQVHAGQGWLDWMREALARAEREQSPQVPQLEAQIAALEQRVAEGSAQVYEGRQQLSAGREQLLQAQQVRSAAAGVRFVSEDGHAALVQLGFDLDPQSMEPAEREQIVAVADELGKVGLTADFGTELVQELSLVGPGEIVGLVTAGLVLLIMLGSLIAAGLPLLTSFVGVGTGVLAALAASAFYDMHSMTPALALMLGLAVGIDYLLFILNRHRQQYLHGMDLHDSIGRAVGTAGSAVVFAGSTVIVALAALVVSGMPILGQMGLVAAGTVTAAVLVSITLGPALLGIIGRHVAGPRARRRALAERQAGHEEEEHGIWFVRLVTVRPWATVAGVLLAVTVLALPALDLRLGLPDGSTEPPDSTAYQAYQTVATEFGPGMNGPLVVVADLPEGTTEAESTQAAAGLGARLLGVSGVDSVVPIGTSEDHRTLAWQVVLESGPTEAATASTVHSLLDQAPYLGQEYDATIGMTGRTVANIEISERMAAALPTYLAVVVGLSLLILLLVFRSVVVPLIATGGFLLSVAAAFGTLVAVFQWGWLGGIFGVHTPGPLLSFGPILLIGVLFGLAMDYQMFLVSGMREAYAHGETARRAVATGFVHGAKVVTAAAAIMFSVFGGFVFSDMVMIRAIGFGLAVGVLVDAVLVRMTLTPAVMQLLGDRAWWIPRWLDRLLPDLDVEGTRLTAKLAAEAAARPARTERELAGV